MGDDLIIARILVLLANHWAENKIDFLSQTFLQLVRALLLRPPLASRKNVQKSDSLLRKGIENNFEIAYL